MPLLPVAAGKVVIDVTPVNAADVYKDGFRMGAGVRANYSLTPQSSTQGLTVDVDGVLCLVDATVSLPVGVVVQNGFPLSGAALCTSTGSVATYANGIPMAANGAVCV